MAIPRSIELFQVGYYLSRFGPVRPPERLNVKKWKEAYYMFYEKLHEGRDISHFEHSLKNTRDTYDSHFLDTQREGWKEDSGDPIELSGYSKDVFEQFRLLSEEQVWLRIAQYADLNAKRYSQIFSDLSIIQETDTVYLKQTKTEGGKKMIVSSIPERKPSLRFDAFKIHGYNCMVCGFNFEDKYGTWGKDWAEVHHIIPLSPDGKEAIRDTDPAKDLAIVCSNCHSMIHRKRDITLSLNELISKLRT